MGGERERDRERERERERERGELKCIHAVIYRIYSIFKEQRG